MADLYSSNSCVCMCVCMQETVKTLKPMGSEESDKKKIMGTQRTQINPISSMHTHTHTYTHLLTHPRLHQTLCSASHQLFSPMSQFTEQEERNWTEQRPLFFFSLHPSFPFPFFSFTFIHFPVPIVFCSLLLFVFIPTLLDEEIYI